MQSDARLFGVFNLRVPASFSLFFAAGFLLHFGVLYPGFMCYDSVNQILEAREGLYSDWHPPLMAIMWRHIEQIIPGQAGMLFLQLGWVWIGAGLIFQAFFKPCCGWLGALLLGLLFFLPPVFGISGAILKDVLMWGALLTAFGFAGQIKSGFGLCRWNIILLGLTVLALWLAILLRHNAVFATIPLLGFALFRLYHRYDFIGLTRAVLPAVLIVGVLFSVSGSINQRLADRHTQPWVANATFDIVGILKRMPDQSAQQALFAVLAGIFHADGSMEPLLKSYTPMYWREVFRSKPPVLRLPEYSIGVQIRGFESFSAEQLDALRRLWTGSIMAEPLLWLRHRLAVSEYVLGWIPDSSWSPVMMEKESPLDLQPAYGVFPTATPLQRTLERLMTDWSNDWFFQPWPYLIVLSMVFLWVCFRPIASNIEIIGLSASGLLHELGLMLAAPSPDYRYSHYMVFCTLLSLLLLARPWMAQRSRVEY